MKCVDCEYYVGDYDETTDCYQPYCPFVDPEPVEYPDWYYEGERTFEIRIIKELSPISINGGDFQIKQAAIG